MAAKALVNYTDHPRKNVFRTLWAKPIIQYLNGILGKKLVYMGLPGIGAFDIKEWIDYLDMVFAYQCLDDDKEYEEAQKEFETLKDYLNACTIRGTLNDYNLYKGYLEQVVMTGYDEDGQEFNQNDYVTVYNLDFCNTLTKPFPVVYPDGKKIECYKLDAVDKLIEHQVNVEEANRSDKFLMFITVNSDFLERNYDDINNSKFKKYRTRINNNGIDPSRQARLIKAYTYYHLNEIFAKYNFRAEFLPPMYYEGSGGRRISGTNQWMPTMMLTFTILGTNIVNHEAPVAHQNVDEYLAMKFLYANNTALSCYTERRIAETDFNPEPIDMIKKSFTVTSLWV